MQKTVYGFRNLHGRKRRALTTTLLVMKLTVLLLTAAMLQVHAAGFSQSVTINDNDLSLKRIFTLIKQQTGYSVFSNRNDLALNKRLSVSVTKMPLRDFMTMIIKVYQPVDFLIKGNTIVLSKRPSLIITDVQKLNITDAPALSVSGIVTDQVNKPLKGVSVTVKAEVTGTQTDENGQFNLSNVPRKMLCWNLVSWVIQHNPIK